MGGSGNVHPQPKVYQLDLSMQAEVEERVQAMVERSSLLSQRLVSTGQVSSGLHSSLPVSFAPVPPPTYSQEASLLLVEPPGHKSTRKPKATLLREAQPETSEKPGEHSSSENHLLHLELARNGQSESTLLGMAEKSSHDEEETDIQEA
ncbi:uncharacterized protein Gm57776 isoform X2 [Mus musculus]|uniref:uncharacterized protein Gm57776 isoform X2 n=1 Tax=Mus musculus TaxID=10090 RepID=UPI001679E799|nr:uncharacterized protein LOC118567399 isoform X2 [Mus musculus]